MKNKIRSGAKELNSLDVAMDAKKNAREAYRMAREAKINALNAKFDTYEAHSILMKYPDVFFEQAQKKGIYKKNLNKKQKRARNSRRARPVRIIKTKKPLLARILFSS